jgi:hypothetical protein
MPNAIAGSSVGMGFTACTDELVAPLLLKRGESGVQGCLAGL